MKNLCLYFLLTKDLGFQYFLFFKKDIAKKKKKFFKNSNGALFLLSGHKNVPFLPVFRVKNEVSKNLCENDAKGITI